ncbi:MAG: hypothetical protein Q9201_005792 [Fulgogasparrea decipioides]
MTLFKKYNAQQLKALEWRYQIMCYALPFIVALVCLFINVPPRGKIYGPASLWCWISIQWVALRIALVYGPAWVAILLSFTLYVISGREIFKKRQQLRAFKHSSPVANPFTSFKTTEVEISSELASLPSSNPFETNRTTVCSKSNSKRVSPTATSYDQYSVKISSTPISPTFGTAPTDVPSTPGSAAAIHHRSNRSAVEANTAAWGYTKVPSSINRVYSLIHPDLVSVPFTYASAVVLPLMGFWNSVIYITTSWSACKDLFFKCFFSARAAHLFPHSSISKVRTQRGRPRETEYGDNGGFVKKHQGESSLSDSTRGLASGDAGSVVRYYGENGV